MDVLPSQSFVAPAPQAAQLKSQPPKAEPVPSKAAPHQGRLGWPKEAPTEQATGSAAERDVVIKFKPAGFDFALTGEPRVTRVLVMRTLITSVGSLRFAAAAATATLRAQDNSEAHRVGLIPGDRIVAVNGQRFADNPHKW